MPLKQSPDIASGRSSSTSSRSFRDKKEKSSADLHFSTYIQRLKKIVHPHLQLSGLALSEIDDITTDFLGNLLFHLRTLRRLTKSKTLTVHDLESATKLSLPFNMANSAVEYGRAAVSRAIQNSSKRLPGESDKEDETCTEDLPQQIEQENGEIQIILRARTISYSQQPESLSKEGNSKTVKSEGANDASDNCPFKLLNENTEKQSTKSKKSRFYELQTNFSEGINNNESTDAEDGHSTDSYLQLLPKINQNTSEAIKYVTSLTYVCLSENSNSNSNDFQVLNVSSFSPCISSSELENKTEEENNSDLFLLHDSNALSSHPCISLSDLENEIEEGNISDLFPLHESSASSSQPNISLPQREIKTEEANSSEIFPPHDSNFSQPFISLSELENKTEEENISDPFPLRDLNTSSQLRLNLLEKNYGTEDKNEEQGVDANFTLNQTSSDNSENISRKETKIFSPLQICPNLPEKSCCMCQKNNESNSRNDFPLHTSSISSFQICLNLPEKDIPAKGSSVEAEIENTIKRHDFTSKTSDISTLLPNIISVDKSNGKRAKIEVVSGIDDAADQSSLERDKKQKIKKNKKDDLSFQTSIKRLKKKLRPELSLSAETVTIIDNFTADFLTRFQDQLRILSLHSSPKTLNISTIETAIKLSLPQRMSVRATEAGRKATDSVISEECERKNNAFDI